MRISSTIFATAITAAMLTSFADEPLATSEPCTFNINLQDATPFSFADFSDMPITWRRGESVRSVSPNGVSSAYATEAPSSGAVALGTLSGGVWTLANEGIATVKVLVPWSVYGDGASFVVYGESYSSFVVDTNGSGPDRKVRAKSPAIPVAYSGDDWSGDLSKAARLTFTPPEGSGLVPTTWSKSNPGTGAQSFTFNAKGVWTITLTFADNTTKTANVTIERTGFVLIVK